MTAARTANFNLSDLSVVHPYMKHALRILPVRICQPGPGSMFYAMNCMTEHAQSMSAMQV